ncbi:MAG: DUF5017 domain-containing protein [Draconibacterium sp.]|nr:DUF5017 domain-containing protein [Draconibacterium sp.]
MTQKNKYNIIAALFISLIFASCNKDEIVPELSVTATPTTVAAGDPVTFEIFGDAETYVIFTGDEGHEYAKSYLAITEGKDVDLEEVALTNDSLIALEPWLKEVMNEQPPTYADSVINVLNNEIVGKTYTNMETAIYEISKIMPDFWREARELVENYFENYSTLLAPEGGFSKGVAINRYKLGYIYIYSQPGTYTAIVIATNISHKKYSGSGYVDDRTSSSNEYTYTREIKEVTITVD